MPICGLTSYEVEAFLTAVVSVATAQTYYVMYIVTSELDAWLTEWILTTT